MMSRLRRHAFYSIGIRLHCCAQLSSSPPSPTIQLAFQKSHADSAATNVRGQGRRKRPRRRDFRPAQPLFKRQARGKRVERPRRSTGLPGGRFSDARSSHRLNAFTPDPALRSWPCYQAECSRRRRSGAPSTARRCDLGSSPHRFDFDPQHRRQTRSRPDARRSQLGASGERDGGPRLAIKGAN
jgi:hypothetical protein